MTTLRASKQGLEIVDQARQVKRWTKTSTAWWHAACTSEATLRRFWQGDRIQKHTFIDICRAVGIDNWRDIAETVEQPIADPLLMATVPSAPSPDAKALQSKATRRESISFRLPEDLIQALRDHADACDITVTELVCRLLRQGLQSNQGMTAPTPLTQLLSHTCPRESPAWEDQVSDLVDRHLTERLPQLLDAYLEQWLKQTGFVVIDPDRAD